MKYLTFKNGDAIPAIGLGTWKSKKGEVYDTIRNAINLGYRHFDCAHVYENEREIGAAIGDAILVGEVNREELFITSKLWNTHHRGEDVIVALKNSLTDLGLDYLNLYLIHWPVAQKKDVFFPTKANDMIGLDQIPLSETWQGMEECLLDGLTRHIGVSNFNQQKLIDVNASANVKIEMNQVELHPLLKQEELLEFCQDHHILVTAYSPLGSPDRHPMMKASDEPLLLEMDIFNNLAKKYNCTAAQILIAWAVNRKTLAIPKSTNVERLSQNLAAANLELSSADMQLIDGLDISYRFVKGDFFEFEGSGYSVAGLWGQ